MKGLIQFTIEIDYDAMITEDKLEVLYGYTGKKTLEELRNLHFEQLGERLVAVVKDLPFVGYDLNGKFFEAQVEEKSLGEMVEGLDGLTREVVQKYMEEYDKVKVEVIEEEDTPAPVDNTSRLIEFLDENIEHVSMTYGMPQQIKINLEMKNALEGKLKILMNGETENGVIQTYRGFPIVHEGMEELFIIDYKGYMNNKVESYSYSRLVDGNED